MSKDYQDPDWMLTISKVIVGVAVNILLMMALVFYLADKWIFAGIVWVLGNILLAVIIHHAESRS